MNHRIGAKGQVVIPKAIRDELMLETGDEVDFALRGDHIILRRAAPPAELRGRYRNLDLTDTLLADRAEDRDREQTR